MTQQAQITAPLPAQISHHTKASLERVELLLEQISKKQARRAPTTAWDRFLALPLDTRDLIQSSWDAQSALLENAIRIGLDASDDQKLLRIVLESFGIELSENILKLMAPGDIVELENWEHISVYRSLNHYSYGRYSLIELCCTPWKDLYSLSELGNEYTLRERLTENLQAFRLDEKLRVRLVSGSGEPFTLLVHRLQESSDIETSIPPGLSESPLSESPRFS